jgi:BirA family biotin operon repressor/biotin-[acetyl-CoA-carboxylase] ligase
MSESPISLPKGYALCFHETLDSTNSEALRQAGEGASSGLWVWAHSQTGGRGRLGRRWESLPGNLFASLLLLSKSAPGQIAQLGFVAGLALHDAVLGLSGNAPHSLTLKWPNDLLLDGKKTGGILLECNAQKNGCQAVAIGIGLNLAAHPDIAERPTTHLAAHGIKATPEAALEQLASAFDSWLRVWASGAGFPEIASAWSERALTKNSPIRVKLADELLEGVYLGIDATGALMLELPDGSERCITTGDVFPL